MNNSFNCAFCLMYGAHVRVDKLTVWEELSFISGLCQVPFCYMGDFNEVVTVDERKGVSILTATTEDFRNWIQHMKLVDLELNDSKFTWFRGLELNNSKFTWFRG
ncbi:uncharacterized protein DS421_9g280720 [Arachis hypogaea]|nr:uncharacterized protein DS421_9g280720 [Arachis hypogaea]